MEKNIPKRRFKEFIGSGDWEEKKLGEVSDIRTGASDLKDSDKDGRYPFFVRSKTIERSNRYIYDGEAILIPGEGKLGDIYHYINGKFDYHQRVYKISDFKHYDVSGKFVFYYLQQNFKVHAFKYTVKATVDSLRLPILTEFRLSIPSLAEQEKIGHFFQKLDRLIDINRQKLDKLRASKSAYLTEMFPREVEDRPRRRFQGFTGAWEEKKLGEVAQFGRGRGYSKSDLKEKGIPIILYGSLYTNYKTIIKSVNTFTNPKNNTVYSLGNEVILPSSGETAEDIVRASVVEEKNIILGGDLNILYLNDEINPIFLSLFISFGDRKKELIKKVQGKSVVHLYNDDLKDVNISIPSLVEQEKIGNFFKKLDEQIELQEEKLEKLEKMKKAYLAEMFV